MIRYGGEGEREGGRKGERDIMQVQEEKGGMSMVNRKRKERRRSDLQVQGGEGRVEGEGARESRKRRRRYN